MGRINIQPNVVLLSVVLSVGGGGCVGSGDDDPDKYPPASKDDATQHIQELAASSYAVAAAVDMQGLCAVTSSSSTGWRETSLLLAHQLEPVRDADRDGLGDAVESDDLYVFGRRAVVEAESSETVLLFLRPYSEELSTECGHFGFHLEEKQSTYPDRGLLYEERLDIVRTTTLGSVDPEDSRRLELPGLSGP